MILVTRYADVAACLRHPAVSSAITPRSLDATPLPVFESYAAVLRRQMDLLDPPRHTLVRRVFGPAFGPAQLDRLQVFAESWVRSRLDALPATFDVIAEIARPLPFAVVSELLGVPEPWRAALAGDVNAFVTGLGNPVASHATVSAALDSLRAMISAALLRPDLQTGSVLALAKDVVPGAIDLDDLISNVILTVAAGHHTTTNLIGNGAWLLWTHSDDHGMAAARRHRWTTAIEEVLRFESPIQTVRRACLDAIEIGGHTLHAGDELVLVLGSANRDPDVFSRADHFDVARAPNRHLAFGAGAHACIGAQLAKVQARAAFEALFESPMLRAVDAEPVWAPSAAFRGLTRLLVTRS